MEIVLLIGAAPYRLDEKSARWLEETIRGRYCDDDGRLFDPPELDEGGRACVQLADVLAEDLERGASPEPIELGRWQIEGLSDVLRDYLVQGNEELTALYYALRRYRGDL